MSRQEIVSQELLPPESSPLVFLFPENGRYPLPERIRPNLFAVKRDVLLIRPDDGETRAVLIGQKVEKGRGTSSFLEKVTQEARNIGGVLMWADKGNLDQITEISKTINGCLGAEAGVWVLENASSLTQEEIDVRKDILESWGLVSRKVVQYNRPWYLWFGRTQKERKQPEPKDYSEKYWFKKRLEMAKIDYLAQGYAQVETAEALSQSSECRNAFALMRKTELGFGVRLRSYCGCVTSVGWNGEKQVKPCTNEGCDGEPTEEDRRYNRRVLDRETAFLVSRGGVFYNDNGDYLIGRNIRISSAIGQRRHCGNCGEELVVDRELVEGYFNRGVIKVNKTLKCPNDDFLPQSGEVRVPLHRIALAKQSDVIGDKNDAGK